ARVANGDQSCHRHGEGPTALSLTRRRRNVTCRRIRAKASAIGRWGSVATNASDLSAVALAEVELSPFASAKGEPVSIIAGSRARGSSEPHLHGPGSGGRGRIRGRATALQPHP